jgi:hypothetical protein
VRSTETFIYRQFPGPSPSFVGGDSGADGCDVKAGGGAAAANRGVETSGTVASHGLGSWVGAREESCLNIDSPKAR